MRTCLALALTSLLALAAQAAQPPALAFGPDTVSVTGITPGADVYLFGLAREGRSYYVQVVPREVILHDSGKTGRVDYSLGRSVPLRSIWFAVDLASGLPIAGTPTDYAAHIVTFGSGHLGRDANGNVSMLAFDGALVDMIVVRPGTGVWGATIGLHGTNDEGSDDRSAKASVLHFAQRAGTTAAAPTSLRNGDVVFLMNSYTAQYSYAVIGGNQ